MDKLDRVVADRIAAGWRVESLTPSIAVLVKGKRPNHILHLILTLLTFGLWILVWINVASWGGERRTTLRLHEDGRLVEDAQRPGAFKNWPTVRREL